MADSGVRPRWIAQQSDFEQLVDELAGVARYGLDTEFHRERTYFPRLALVQVSWEGGIALIDPLAVNLTALGGVLDGDGTAVLHAAEQDLEVLERACGTIPRHIFDTQIAAGFLGYSTASLTSLVAAVLGEKMVKGDRLSDWLRRPLSEAQLAYAAADVVHLLDLHAQLRERLVTAGRDAWVEEEFRALALRQVTPNDPETAWWRLKDSRSLRGSSRAVAQAVAAWREMRAAAVDRPVRNVLSDMAVQTIAQAQPSDVPSLRKLRGVDGRQLTDAVAEELIAVVHAARDQPVTEIRRPPGREVDRQLRPAVTLISAWVAQLARDLQIDPALLATRGDLVDFLNGEADCRLATTWRAGVLGEPIRRLVEGDAAVAFTRRSGAVVLEERSRRPIAVDLPSLEE